MNPMFLEQPQHTQVSDITFTDDSMLVSVKVEGLEKAFYGALETVFLTLYPKIPSDLNFNIELPAYLRDRVVINYF